MQPSILPLENVEKQNNPQNKIENSNENINGIKITNQLETRLENTNNSNQNKGQVSKQQIINKQKEVLETSKTKETPKIQIQSLSKARDLISQGKYNSAIAECDRILSINPRNSEALSLKKWSQKQLKILNPRICKFNKNNFACYILISHISDNIFTISRDL